MKKLYKVEKIALNNVDSTFANAWVELLKQAPQASFFSQLHYLTVLQNVFQYPVDLWYIPEGENIRAGGVLFPGGLFKKVLYHREYAYYTGMMIRESAREQLSNKTIRRNRVYHSFMQFIEAEYAKACFRLTPQMTDIRELVLAKNWQAHINYTFMIHRPSPDTFLKNMQRGERRRIKNITIPGERVYHYDPSEFANLVVSGHRRYKIKPKATREALKAWLLDMQYLQGIYFMGVNNPDGSLSSGLLWSEFKQTACFFLAASQSPDKNNTSGHLPYILYQVMDHLHKKRINRVDLPGDEDKKRSVFKMDMGAVPQPFYTLSYASHPFLKFL